MLNKVSKNGASQHIKIMIVALLGKIILVVIIIAMVLAPFAYAYILFKNLFDEMANGWLKLSANVQTSMSEWFGKDTSAENYGEYLMERFSQLYDDMDDDAPDEINEKKNIAVNWVYGKIYTSYFETSVFDSLKDTLPFYKDENTVYDYTTVEDAAKNIVSPEKRIQLVEMREKVFGDKINVYDVMAFDFVAGSLFDMLNADMALIEEMVEERYEDEFSAEVGDALRVNALQGATNLFSRYDSVIDGSLNGIDSGTLVKLFEAYGISKSKLPVEENFGSIIEAYKKYEKDIDLSLTAKSVLDIISANGAKYSPSSAAEKVINAYESMWEEEDKKNKEADAKAKADWDKEQERLKKEFEEDNPGEIYKSDEEYESKIKPVYKYEYHYKAVSDVRSVYGAITRVYEKIIEQAVEETDSIKDADKKAIIIKISNGMREQVNEKQGLGGKTYEGYSNAITQMDKIKDVFIKAKIKKKVEEELAGLIKELNLERSDKAAQTFRKKLTEVKTPQSTIAYRVLDISKVPKINELVSTDKVVGVSLGFDIGVGKMVPRILRTASDEASRVNYIETIAKENTTIDFDRNNLPIVSSIDESTGVEYRAGAFESYVRILEGLVEDIAKEYEKLLFKEGNKEENLKMIQDFLKSTTCILNNGESTGQGMCDKSLYGVYDLRDLINKSSESKEYFGGFIDTVMAAEKELRDKAAGANVDAVVKYVEEKSLTTADGVSDETVEAWNTYKSGKAYESLKMLYDLRYAAVELGKESPDYGKLGNVKSLLSGIDSLVAEEIGKLDDIKKTLKDIKEKGVTDDMLKPADIRKVIVKGEEKEINPEFIKDGSKLLAPQYKNTLEEAVKATAKSAYGDVLKKWKGGNVASGTVVDIGDLEIGTEVGNQAYEATMKYWDIIERVCESNNVDPYFMVAMICVESSGNPNLTGAAVGLTQIEDVHINEQTVTLPDGSTVWMQKDNLLIPEESIKAGIWELTEAFKLARHNPLMGLMMYNYGIAGGQRAMSYYLDSQGIVNIEDWAQREAPKHMVEAIMEYAESGDIGWLVSDARMWYSTPGPYSTISKDMNYNNNPKGWRFFYPTADYTGGNPLHLERFLRHYNTENGMPWAYNPDTGEKVYLGGATAVMEKGKETYHDKNGNLTLWNEYYTKNGVFDSAEKWYEESIKDSSLSKSLRRVIYTSVKDATKFHKDKLEEASVSVVEFENVLAGIINLENAFKFEQKTDFAIKTEIMKIADGLKNSIVKYGGKDVAYAVYHYVSTDKSLAEYEIGEADLDFCVFVDDILEKNGQTLANAPLNIRNTIQILSGNRNVDIKSFMSKRGEVEVKITSEEVEQRFYDEWISAKYTLHDIYNAVTDKKGEDGERVYEKLPTLDDLEAKDVADKDLIGVINMENKGGKPSKVTVPLRKKPLEANYNKDEKRDNNSIKNIVIHESSLDVDSLYRRYNSVGKDMSMNYVIDSREAYEFVPVIHSAKHLKNPSGGLSNGNTIGIEMAAPKGTNADVVFWNTVATTKYLMNEYNIPVENVRLHDDVDSDKCAKLMKDKITEKVDGKEVERTYWEKFIEALKNKSISIGFEGNTAVSAGQFIMPTTGTITSLFNPNRFHQILGTVRPHKGLDIGNNVGTPIVASDGGVVTLAIADQGSSKVSYGNQVLINHGNGFETRYPHLSAVDVKVGDMVTQGQQIGKMGSSGVSTGPHLHMEIIKDGVHEDPMNYLGKVKEGDSVKVGTPGKEIGGVGKKGAQKVIQYARTLKGSPYVWGGEGVPINRANIERLYKQFTNSADREKGKDPHGYKKIQKVHFNGVFKGYDCSGFVRSVFKTVGVNMKGGTHELVKQGEEVKATSIDQLQPGDVVFPHAGHVGIYTGNGKMIHSPSAGRHVEEIDYNSVYKGIFAARRFL